MEDFPKRDLDDYFCRFTFGQFITLILLEIVTLFFVFYLGARYGSDLVGSREEMHRDPTSEGSPKSVNDIVGNPPVDYTYPEVLTDQEGGRRAIRVKPSGVTAEDYARRPPEAREPQVTAPEPVAPEPVAPEPVPEPLPEPIVEEQIPPPAPAVKPKGAFAVQVGSYQTAQEAAQVLARWKKKGYAAYQVSAAIPGRGTWYRVRLGGFAKREEAVKYLDRFKAKEKAEAIVVSTKN